MTNEVCTACGAPVHRYPSQAKRGRPFCSRACHMAYLNAELNPTRMTESVKDKISHTRLASNSAQPNTYRKIRGRHTHRQVAEKILGRPLKQGEIVHHIDGDKHNNAEDNLIVFPSQREHAQWHSDHDSNWGRKKVITND